MLVSRQPRGRGWPELEHATRPFLARDPMPLTPFGGGGTLTNPFPTQTQEPVTPEGPSHGTPIDQLHVSRWVDAPVVEGPEVPKPVSIAVPQYPPHAVGWRSSAQGPGGLERTRYNFPDREGRLPTGPPVMALEAEKQRVQVWGAYQGLVRETVDSHNSLIGPISAYKNVSNDPKVAQAGLGPDLAEQAMKRTVPRTSKSHVTVESLFTPAGKPGAPQPKPGTDVQTQGLEESMARSKRSSTVERLRMRVDAAEDDVLAQLKDIKKELVLSEQAGHDLQAAVGGVEEFEAEQKKKQGEKELEAAKAKAEEWKKWIERGLKAVALMSGALAPVVLATEVASAAEGGGEGGGAAGKVKSVAESGVTSTIANKIVDLATASEIRKAAKKIEEAEGEMTQAKGKQVRERKAGAESGFAASLIAVDEATLVLKKKMKEREAALMEFGDATASAGGGGQRTGDRMRGIVQAVPVVESVVAAAENIEAAVHVPAHSDDAGRGLNVSLYAMYDDGPQFLHTVGLLKGYKQHYAGIRDEWKARLTSLRGAMDKMSASDTSGP